MKRIIYFHGFASSGASGTVELLRRYLPDLDIEAPDIPIDPVEALPFLHDYCQAQQPDLIIGTSMGGMYAQQMFGYTRICINPACNMSTSSKLLKTGVHQFFNRRKDNQKEFRITKEILQHWNQMERRQWDGITDYDLEHCYGLFGINDPLVHTYDVFHKHYPHAIRFEGEHRVNDKVLRTTILPLVKQLLPD